MSRYPKLGVVEFGKQLFTSGDLDPIYVALLHTKMEQGQLHRWLIAYWLFYSAGFASWASEREGKAFWKALAIAADNETPTPYLERWPRGSERRHFRGAVAGNCVRLLEGKYGAKPENFVAFLLDGPLDVRSVVERAKTHYLFGDWIAFKVADMLDAVCGVSVSQEDLTVFLYDTPKKSILEKWKAGDLPLVAKTEEAALVEAMDWLRHRMSADRIPHKPKQGPDWFSLETVWCKHHSHMHGHYPLLKDVNEIGHGLIAWSPHSKTAKRFAAAMPKGRAAFA